MCHRCCLIGWKLGKAWVQIYNYRFRYSLQIQLRVIKLRSSVGLGSFCNLFALSYSDQLILFFCIYVRVEAASFIHNFCRVRFIVSWLYHLHWLIRVFIPCLLFCEVLFHRSVLWNISTSDFWHTCPSITSCLLVLWSLFQSHRRCWRSILSHVFLKVF